MSKRMLGVWVILFLGLCAVGANGQTCGDVNRTGSLTVGDLVIIIEEIAMYPGILDDEVSFDAWAADCDGRVGVTIGDAAALSTTLFKDPGLPLQCDPTGTYGFAPSPNDTVFIPYIDELPDGLESLVLPIYVSLETDVKGIYIPLLIGDEYVTNFDITGAGAAVRESAFGALTPMWGGWANDPDTSVLIFTNLDYQAELEPRREVGFIECSRIAPGVGSFHPVPVDREGNWVQSIFKGDDLRIPQVMYYQYVLPDPTLSVSASSLSFTATAGQVGNDTYQVSFTSEPYSVEVALEVSEPWITVEEDISVPLATPFTLTVGVDATQAPVGEYSGQISIIDVFPLETDIAVSEINIAMTVNEPGVYPRGDVTCDGIISIGDISRLIDFLFITHAPLPECD